MKQLYYTSCRSGKSLGGSSGFQIRAISSDIPPERLRASISYIGYSLPVDIIPNEKTYLTSQIRLAFLDTPDAGKLLCHSVYIGKDPMTGRFGNFFSHVLLNIPENVHAIDAIQSWDSDFWKRNDSDTNTNLDDVLILPEGNISENDFYKFIENEANKDMFDFLLKAIFLIKEEGRIFVAAPAYEIALCIFGITQAIPSTIKPFTFSTYESNPLSCIGKLVGTWLGNSKDSELPSSCFRGSNIGYNKITGKKTDINIPKDNIFLKSYLSNIKTKGAFKFFTDLRKESKNFEINSFELFDVFLKFKNNQYFKKELPSDDDLKKLLSNDGISMFILNESINPKFYELIFSGVNKNEYLKHETYLSIGKLFLKYNDSSIPNVTKIENKNIVKRIESWRLIASFMESPNFNEETLKAISNEIEIVNHFYSQIITLAIESMSKRNPNNCDKIKQDLELFIKHVGNTEKSKSIKFFKDLLDKFSEPKLKFFNFELLEAIIQIGLNLEEDKGRELIKEYLENKTKVTNYILNKLDENSQTWEKKAKNYWLNLTEDLIDRRTFAKKTYDLFIILCWIINISFMIAVGCFFYDEYYSQKFMLITKFYNGCSVVSGFVKSIKEKLDLKASPTDQKDSKIPTKK